VAGRCRLTLPLSMIAKYNQELHRASQFSARSCPKYGDRDRVSMTGEHKAKGKQTQAAQTRSSSLPRERAIFYLLKQGNSPNFPIGSICPWQKQTDPVAFRKKEKRGLEFLSLIVLLPVKPVLCGQRQRHAVSVLSRVLGAHSHAYD